jgi:Rrf2 family protein
MSINNGNHPTGPLPPISAKVEYALLALMELVDARTLKEPLTISAIAARQPIPERYLEHIFTLLRKGGIVQSQRGAKGGYVLSIEPWKLTILEVVNLMDGTSRDLPNSRNRNSPEGGQPPSIERDLVSEVFQQATDVSRNVLRRYTLQDLSYRRDDRKQKNLMYYI